MKKYTYFIGLFMLTAGLLSNAPKEEGVEYYQLDTENSSVNWDCSKHRGNVKIKEVALNFEGGKLTEADCTIDMTTIIDTDIDYDLMRKTLENTLKSLVFFDTKIFPVAHFELHSTNLIENNSYILSGDFIILGKPVCHSFIAEIEFRNDSLFIDTNPIQLDRTDWGIFYLSDKNPNPSEEEQGFVVSDTITIDIHLQAYKKS